MSSRTSLDALLLFYEIVNTGSINKAAEKLDMPKSTISRRLRLLEEQTGSVLLKRGAGKPVLTDVGKVLYGHTVRIVAEIEDAGLQASEIQQEMRGTLRVSLPMDFWMSWVGEAVSEFAQAHPEIQLEVHNHDRWVDVTSEPYDVAIHISAIRNADVPVKRLGTIGRGFYASPGYLARKGEPRYMRDLLEHDCIVHTYQRADGIWTVPGQEGEESADIPCRFCVGSIGFARLLAINGLGVALLPHNMCGGDVAAESLARVLHGSEAPPLSVSASFIGRRNLPRKTRAFLDFIATRLVSCEAENSSVK